MNFSNLTKSVVYGLNKTGGVYTTTGLRSDDKPPENVGLPNNDGLLGILRVTYFITVAVACFFGNGLTLYAVATTERLKVKAYVFTTSLACADFLYGFRLCIITGYNIATNDPCGLAEFKSYVRPIEKLFWLFSFFNICSVTIDRYFAVLYPMIYHNVMTPSTIRNILIAVWGAAFLLALIPYLGLLNDPNIGEHTSCLATLWPVFDALFELTVYVVYSAIVIFVYSRIWSAAMRLNMNEVHPHRYEPQGMTSNTSVSHSNVSTSHSTMVANNVGRRWEKWAEKWSKVSYLIAQQRVTRTVMTLMAVYVIFWFPYFFARIYALVYGPVVSQFIQGVGGAVGITGIGLNVFVYNFTNKDYRSAFKRILFRDRNAVGELPH